MRVLSFSYCFPNHVNPTWGMFVYQRLAALSVREDLEVCSPAPWFPLLELMRGDPGPRTESWRMLTLHRPRFFYLPGVLKNHDARFYYLGLRRWLRSFCDTWRPNVLDAHFIWPDGVAVAALAKEFKIPCAITLRGKLYECLPIDSQRRQCMEALRQADAVISVSGRLAEEARKLGTPDDRLFVIPNGVNREMYFPRNKLQCRRELGLPETGRLLVTVSHLGHRKGHHEVIRALAELPADIRLCIVGGPAQGGTEEELRGLAAEVGVNGRLILPGHQPYENIPKYFCAADASILASYREGCPNAVLESLACGTPVVATDVGAVRDILPVPEAGRIVPPLEGAPLRDAVADVLARDWAPHEVVRKSGVRSWDQVAEEVQKVLAAIVRK